MAEASPTGYDKKKLREADIRTKFITPALAGADGNKWDVLTQLREEIYFTKSRVIVRGKTVKRGEAKKADYLLYYKPGIPIAVIEAKDNNHAVGAGMQQALEYAETKGIILRGESKKYGSDGWFRVTIGSAEENKLFVDTVLELFGVKK